MKAVIPSFWSWWKAHTETAVFNLISRLTINIHVVLNSRFANDTAMGARRQFFRHFSRLFIKIPVRKSY